MSAELAGFEGLTMQPTATMLAFIRAMRRDNHGKMTNR